MSWSNEEIYKMTAELELKDGIFVNLGIGMPTNVANYTPKGVNVVLQSENGMLGMGEFPSHEQIDPDLINAGKQTITEKDGCSYFDSAFSFAMIRGGHMDLCILGALQISERGDLANWTIPGKMVKGMGGAMDLVAGAKRVVIIMEHSAKDGSSKLVKNCVFPLTGKQVVNRVITNLAIFDFHHGKMSLVKMAPNLTIEEIKAKTEASFEIKV